MLRITPIRERISDRFPVASFVVSAPPDRYFEVACATDPALFRGDQRHRRTNHNFATSRVGGFLRAPAGQATYMIPPQQLRRFAGAQRLYYAMAAFRGPHAQDPVLTLSTERLGEVPSIQIGADFTGRTLDRGRGEVADARYGGASEPLVWAGDAVVAAAAPRLGAAAPAPAAAPVPAAVFAYDDGFDVGLWDQPAAVAGGEPDGWEDAAAYGRAGGAPPLRVADDLPGYEDAATVPRHGPARLGARRLGGPNDAGASPPPTDAPLVADCWTQPAASLGRPVPAARYGGAVRAAHHERYGSAAPARWRDDDVDLDDDADGYEDVPDLVRRFGGRYRAFGGDPAPAPAPAPAAPVAAGDGPARFADFSDELVGDEPLPATAQGLAVDAFDPGDPRQRLRIVHRVAIAESGGAGYAAINADREWSDPSLPEFYQRKHVGLSWGLIQFAQRYGGLGFVLGVCNRRDPAAFARCFGAHHAAAPDADPRTLPAGHLLRVTNDPSEDARLAPIAPPPGGEPVELWREPWLRAFAEAGAVTAFQEAQREAADRRYYAPYLDVIAAIGLTTARGHAAFVDRAIHMGGGGALRWILRTAGPIRSQDHLRTALAHLGHADLASFQRDAGVAVDGRFGPLTHAALMRALRATPGAPIAVAGEDAIIAALIADAERQATTSTSRIWRITAQRLRALRDDPALASVPAEPEAPR